MSLKISHVGSKTRSLGQILDKHCVRSRGHIFSLINIKFGQYVCHDEISEEFVNGLCRVKNEVTRSNLKKDLEYTPEATFPVL